MKQLLFFFVFLIYSASIFGQELVQNIKGRITDLQSGAPIPGVMVQLLAGDSTNATMSDLGGNYKLQQVPVGRVSILFQLMSYENVLQPNLVVTSGKELIVNVSMEESVNELDEVKITIRKNSSEANNENVVISNIKLNPQQTQKFAGSLQDLSRTAANYAGIVPAGDQRNDIIVRGNSPTGIIWRLDGVNIPNPNHFGSLGTTGGPVSILNNNNLAGSDFLTGAFPAEYGNGVAGAFDLRLRTGNNDKFEFTGQMGFNGLEVGLEGPFSKKKKASYLVNYRYSTLGIFNALGISFGVSAVPQYQDLAFKIDLPSNGKRGRFQLFGVGGLSYIELLDSQRDPEEWTFTNSGTDVYFKTNMGVIGLNHKIFLSKNTYWSNTLSTTHSQNDIQSDTLAWDTSIPSTNYNNNSSEGKISLNSTLNTKFSAKSSLKNGVILDLMNTNYKEEIYSSYQQTWLPIVDFSGSSVLLQAFSQWRYKFSNKMILNTGAHYQLFTLNNKWIVEPRLGFRYKLNKKQSLNIASGLHSQIHPLRVYLLSTQLANGNFIKTNENLDFTKSIHVVLGYKINLKKNLNAKIETYYQSLYHIPVEADSYFSLSNIGADFGFNDTDSLINQGTGENYGMELTLEKMFSKGFYYLANVSLYNSTYIAGDKVKRNTAFNGQYTANLLAGYEIKLTRKLTLEIDAKASFAGGKRYPKIDLNASIENGSISYDPRSLYELKYKDYFRTDLKIGVRLNGNKTTQQWYFDIQNLTNRQNVFREVFDTGSQTIRQEYQMGFFPVALYRITF